MEDGRGPGRHGGGMVDQAGAALRRRRQQIRATGTPEVARAIVEGSGVGAPGKLGKGGSHKRKPFGGTLRVTSPVRQSLASGRERVWRGAGATRAAKRRQPVGGPCD